MPQDLSTKPATLRREASALVVGQREAAPFHLVLEERRQLARWEMIEELQ